MAQEQKTLGAIEDKTAWVRQEMVHLAESARQEIRDIATEVHYRVEVMSPRQQALDREGEQRYDRIYDRRTYQENLQIGAYHEIDRLWRRHAAENGLDARPSWERGANTDVSR